MEAAYTRKFRELYDLIDRDAAAAIRDVETLEPSGTLLAAHIKSLQASVFVDAGTAIGDRNVVQRGVDLFQGMLDDDPGREHVVYNLANGLACLADLTKFRGPTWYFETDHLRREARSLFHEVASSKSRADLRGRSYTNLGNALLRAYRFIEAYDQYARALECDPTNAIAETGAARLLLGFAAKTPADKLRLRAIASRHLLYVRSNPARIRELAGERAHAALSKLLEENLPDPPKVDLSSLGKYERFVATHRLALAPTLDGLDMSTNKWDTLELESISVPIDAPNHVPEIFAMFNVLKGEYLNARRLAFAAIQDDQGDSGTYADTLDYAIYGVRPAALGLAQRTAIDLLDKIAVAASHYFDVDMPAKDVTFRRLWFKDDKATDWRPEIKVEIGRGNTALIALGEICRDVAAGGYLQKKQKVRHSSTHRFVVLHDIGMPKEVGRGHIEHYRLSDFIGDMIETLQFVRAALFYFVEAVSISELGKHPDSSKLFPLSVPDHDWIRGRNRG